MTHLGPGTPYITKLNKTLIIRVAVRGRPETEYQGLEFSIWAPARLMREAGKEWATGVLSATDSGRNFQGQDGDVKEES